MLFRIPPSFRAARGPVALVYHPTRWGGARGIEVIGPGMPGRLPGGTEPKRPRPNAKNASPLIRPLRFARPPTLTSCWEPARPCFQSVSADQFRTRSSPDEAAQNLGSRARSRWLGSRCAGAPAPSSPTSPQITPTVSGGAINKSFAQEIGAGRGNILTPDSSAFIISRDPFRAIRRGRQIFQRKFNVSQGQAPKTDDGIGNVALVGGDRSRVAGLSDSCAGCHGRPRGSAGFGGDVVTRPDSRDAPHLFGLGLQEQLGDEMTRALRGQRAGALAQADADGAARDAHAAHQGGQLRHHHREPRRHRRHVGRRGRQRGSPRAPVLRRGRRPSPSASSWSARSTPRWGWSRPISDLLLASSGGSVLTPAGMVLDGRNDADRGGPRSPPPPPTATATA